jgi:hypothetical protein
VSERDRSRGAELRAERIRWRGRSRNMNQASRSMDEHLRKMKDQGAARFLGGKKLPIAASLAPI